MTTMQLVRSLRTVPRVALTIAGLCGFAVMAWAAEPKGRDDKIWSFRRPELQPIPAIRNQIWIRNPIDTFVLQRLEKAGLQPSAEADRATLIRRLSFDLTGLPPTPAEVETFVSDSAPDAYERLVHR